VTHTVETRIKLSIHRYASRIPTLEIEGRADKNLFSFRKLFAAHLKTSYLKYALDWVKFGQNPDVKKLNLVPVPARRFFD